MPIKTDKTSIKYSSQISFQESHISKTFEGQYVEKENKLTILVLGEFWNINVIETLTFTLSAVI